MMRIHKPYVNYVKVRTVRMHGREALHIPYKNIHFYLIIATILFPIDLYHLSITIHPLWLNEVGI